MASTIRDKDRGYKALMRRALSRDGSYVAVGVQGNRAEEDHGGISNVRLAGVHEFGARIDTGNGVVTIPQRSFIRATVDEHQRDYAELGRNLASAVLSGRITDVKAALSIFGERVRSDILTRIERGIDPPNAPSTIAKKGSSKPLVDTGAMKNAITYEVRRDR